MSIHVYATNPSPEFSEMEYLYEHARGITNALDAMSLSSVRAVGAVCVILPLIALIGCALKLRSIGKADIIPACTGGIDWWFFQVLRSVPLTVIALALVISTGIWFVFVAFLWVVFILQHGHIIPEGGRGGELSIGGPVGIGVSWWVGSLLLRTHGLVRKWEAERNGQ